MSHVTAPVLAVDIATVALPPLTKTMHKGMRMSAKGECVAHCTPTTRPQGAQATARCPVAQPHQSLPSTRQPSDCMACQQHRFPQALPTCDPVTSPPLCG